MRRSSAGRDHYTSYYESQVDIPDNTSTLSIGNGFAFVLTDFLFLVFSTLAEISSLKSERGSWEGRAWSCFVIFDLRTLLRVCESSTCNSGT